MAVKRLTARQRAEKFRKEVNKRKKNVKQSTTESYKPTIKNRNLKELSDISTITLINHTNSTMFKRPVSERVKSLGGFTYKGFEYVYHQGKDGRTYLFITLYFNIISSPKTKKGKKAKRETYLLAVKFPYLQGMNKMDKVFDAPVELFSSDPSFMFYFAYALKTHRAVIDDHPKFTKWLGEALTRKPKIRNPNLRTELTKHFYKVLIFLKTQPPKKYLDKRYLTDVTKISFPNISQMNRIKRG
jgi:hypothetical protein